LIRKRWQLFLFQAVQSHAPRAARGLSQDHVTMQALWMVLAAFLFASMGVCVKIASDFFNSAELVCYRGLIGMAILWLLARSQKVTLATQYPGMHAWRSLVGVASLGAWFYAIAHLPLATAMTLNYMSSVWIAAFLVGGTLLAWRPSAASPRPALQGPLILTVLTGFVGVVLMLRPSLDQNQAFAGMIGLMSGLTAAFAYMQVVALSRLGEPESRTVFYFAVGSAVAGGGAMLFTGMSDWPGWQALWLLPIGVLAAGGQLCMTKAYASAKTQRGTLVVANLQYSGIVFAAVYSVLLFGDKIPPIGWFGMALIVGSGIVATILRARAAPGAPAEEH
jgi:drug/metabolite transporter (DMT)-like permease